MGGVDIGKIKCSFYEVFLKVILTKCCTVEQKKWQFLKTHVNSSKKRTRHHKKRSKTIKTHANNSKNGAKGRADTPSIPAPGRPSDRNITRHAPTQLRLARTHGTHDTHETKTKTKRSRSPGHGGKDKPF